MPRRFNIPGNSRCQTPGCRFASEKDQPVCCKGCPWHTRNCYQRVWQPPGAAQPVSAAPPEFVPFSGRIHRLEPVGNPFSCFFSNYNLYRIPESWIRRDTPVMEYLGWYLEHYQFRFDEQVLAEWQQIETPCATVWNQSDPEGCNLIIHAYPYSQKPTGLRYIDLDNTIPCDAHGAADLSHVTGCDFVIQAKLVRQAAVAAALRLAVLEIEMLSLRDFVFTCRGGTHRSVGCACLLAALRYPQAKLNFHTPRTNASASERLVHCSAP